MTKILFICHGNICRSAAAEMVLKQMAREKGRRDLAIASAAATREEIGNDIYPPMKKALQAAGYTCEPHAARQTVRADYGRWDCLIGMDDEKRWDMERIYGGDPEKKISMLMDWAGGGKGNRRPLVYPGFSRGAEADRRGLRRDSCPNTSEPTKMTGITSGWTASAPAARRPGRPSYPESAGGRTGRRSWC